MNKLNITLKDTTTQKKRKVLIIGPIQPFRGGIAQHTTMLYREIFKENECLAISFSRQYPGWLYPGRSDQVPNGTNEPGVEYTLDSLNPLTWLRVFRRGINFAPSIVVFPWWHVYWFVCFGWLAGRFRKHSMQVVFICHNVIAHEDSWWKRLLTKLTFSNASRFVVHTQKDKLNLIESIPDAQVDIHPLPVFEQFPAPHFLLPRRARLELLFFGFVRHYKGLDLLLEAMFLLKDKDIHLSIVGEFWKDESKTRHQIFAAGLENNVELVSNYVSDAEAAEYFSRTDVVVLPYRSATGSAVIPLAYFYDKPVIATCVGGLPDVVEDGLSGLLISPDSPVELARAIENMYKGEFVPNLTSIERLKEKMTWFSYANVVAGDEV